MKAQAGVARESLLARARWLAGVFALNGVEPATPLLFRVDLVRTLRDVRDVEILVLSHQCLATT